MLNKIIIRNRDNRTNKLENLSDENILNTPRDIVNEFNKYFIEVGLHP